MRYSLDKNSFCCTKPTFETVLFLTYTYNQWWLVYMRTSARVLPIQTQEKLENIKYAAGHYTQSTLLWNNCAQNQFDRPNILDATRWLIKFYSYSYSSLTFIS